MKNICTIVLSVLVGFSVDAQSVSINGDGSAADPSSILDLKSNNKGFLMPRLTDSEMNGVSGPAEGLLVFNTSTKTFWFFDGVTWAELSGGGSSFSISNLSFDNDGDSVVVSYLGNPIDTFSLDRECPTGFVDAGEFCIQVNEQSSFVWFKDAQSYCRSIKARLCTVGEWVDACYQGPVLGLTNMTNGFEWVDDFTQDYDGGTVLVGYLNDCNFITAGAHTDLVRFRCCRDK